MAGLFGKLFKSKGESVLGIDVGSSSIKVVQIKRKGGRALLETYGELSLGPYAGTEIGRATNLSADKIIEALRDVLREAHTTTSKCGIAIPFASSLMTVMEMPDLPQKQLAPMIPIEARKYIPVPISEVLLDWWLIPKVETPTMEPETEDDLAVKKGKKVDILVVAIHNDVINRYQQIVQSTGLEAGFLEIEIFSSIRSVIEQDVAPVMIFDMGAASTKLYIIELYHRTRCYSKLTHRQPRITRYHPHARSITLDLG
jgi:type IV pilus assembly protein PilM